MRFPSDPAGWTVSLLTRFADRFLVAPCMKCGVTPNQITVLNLVVCAPLYIALMATGSYARQLVALGVLVVYALIDCLDGVLARATGTGSALGAWLDNRCDFLLQIVVLTAVSLGLLLHEPTALQLVWCLGAFASLGALVQYTDMYGGLFTRREAFWCEVHAARLGRLEGLLAHVISADKRIAIPLLTYRYALVVGTLLGRLDLFMAYIAISQLLRFLVLHVYMYRAANGGRGLAAIVARYAIEKGVGAWPEVDPEALSEAVEGDGGRVVLLNPGPVTLSRRVRNAMRSPDICHREPEFDELLESVRASLLAVYSLRNDEFAAVVLCGSGTAAVEAGLTAAAGRDERLLIVSNGVYGERMLKMAASHGMAHDILRLDWGEEIPLADLEATLSRDTFHAVAVVHHETTTGVLNDVARIAGVAKEHGARVVVDAVSSFAGEPMDFASLDFACGTANKCIHGVPGAAFVIVRRSALATVPDPLPRSVYLDLARHLAAADKGEPAFTPGIPALYALNVALEELLEEGVGQRMQAYSRRAEYIRKELAALGFEVAFPMHRFGRTLTSFRLPQGLGYEQLHDHLKERGFVIYAGQAGLRKEIFRIANMGDITDDDLRRLVDAFRELGFGEATPDH